VRREEYKIALQETLDELIFAGSIEAMRDVVAAHPEVLGDDAVEIIARITEEQSDRLRPLLENVLAALMEWRARGIDAPLPEVDVSLPSDPSEDLAQAIEVSDDVDALVALAAQSRYLLSDDAEQALLEMEADSSAYTADRFLALVRLLRACRNGDSVAGADAYARDLADVDEAGARAAEYFMTDEDVAVEFVREHPVLLGRQAEASLALLSEAFAGAGDDEAAQVRRKVETIERLREDERGGR
jgi:hypothetical protein